MNLSDLGPSAAAVAVVLLFLKYMREENTRKDTQHDETIKALGKVSESMDVNTTVAKQSPELTLQAMDLQRETTTYLKHRNGSFEKLIKEQPQIHQLVKEHFDGGVED